METFEIKKELHSIIDSGNDKFVKNFYKIAKSYLRQLENDKRIFEGEEDIKEGKVHSQAEVQKMIESWMK
ncbi:MULTISPECIES: hypothetical protein [Mesonia]|uniref:Uncharacterized protein n=1 Tax=Mesonia oceanica TaxID=2687242 RepID=A0AC61Y577_9FLAO|nr:MULTISPECIES: hypothetical protein [Mesonia]MAN28717.1 hypothetical protein [Mesonia sp.]MAQ41962.1 hypothetical protein [Mesonia sp.]MBJ99358.1 hypothetical protein [Flavobacteriaceae bacterium]VVU99641.1 hypothetical protein FVB9532_00897 [Mesonia oceanica]|tara:strand:+ start:10767 stop:10976 length:210 start_codon:yes stop_codon:yes gene_type:complete